MRQGLLLLLEFVNECIKIIEGQNRNNGSEDFFTHDRICLGCKVELLFQQGGILGSQCGNAGEVILKPS